MATVLCKEIVVRIVQMKGSRAPRPLPLDCGFNEKDEYEVFGVGDYSESSEAYFVLVNADDQFYWISNRHVRLVRGVLSGVKKLGENYSE